MFKLGNQSTGVIMKKLAKITLSLLVSSVLISSAFADADVIKETAVAKPTVVTNTVSQDNVADASYTIGYSIGKNMTEQLHQQNVTLDIDNLEQGFTAGIKGNKPKLTQEQMEQSMQAFQKEMEAKMKADEEAAEAEAAKTKTESEANFKATTNNAEHAAISVQPSVDSTKEAADTTNNNN